MTLSPYTQGYYDGYADLPCNKQHWWDSVEETTQYLIGVKAGMLDALLEVQQHNERHTYA